MTLGTFSPIRSGEALDLYTVRQGGGEAFPRLESVSLVGDTAVVVMRIGPDKVEASRVAGLVAYMRTQGYELINQGFYQGEAVGGGWPGHWMNLSAVFVRAPRT